MKLRCPHNKYLEIKGTLGLLYYVHEEDDSDCNVLNKFNASANRAMSIMTSSRKVNFKDKVVRISLKNSPLARAKLYKSMEKLKVKALVESFKELASLGIDVNVLSQELMDAFGERGPDNFRAATSAYMPRLKVKSKPRFKITDLQSEALTSTLDEIRGQVDSSAARRQAAIEAATRSQRYR